MRRPVPLLLLVLLSACTVTTTGAPCTSDLNCPSDQGCGNDRTCSTAALSCPGHQTGGECQPGTSCSGGRLVTCSPASGVCSTGPVTTDCPAHQACAVEGGAAGCACQPTACGAATPTVCGPSGEVVTCARDATPPGCWYEASSAPCADPAQACTRSGGAAACACPTANACSVEGALTCAATGQGVLRCQPAAAGSTCLTWQGVTDCATGGLVCSAGACACPPNPGPVFLADAVGGSPASATPSPTGVANPPACRFATLTDALAAAGAGGTVRATGWSAAVPGGVVRFTEPGAVSVPAGTTVTTDDPTPDPDHYAVVTAAALGGPFVALGPGASFSGLEVRNGASTGPAIQAACPATADTAPVTLSGVRVAAATGGTPPTRFSAGLQVGGNCGVTATDFTVSGAAIGVVVDPLAASVEVAASGLHVTGTTLAAATVVDGKLTLTGGTVDGNASGVLVGNTGAGSPSFTATGTTFSGNAGDAVFVARGTVLTDACPYVNNGTHVHAQPTTGSAVHLTVQNSSGAAKMTGATNSAFRLLAMGSGSTLVLTGNEVVGNSATQDYNVSTGLRRGGGVVFTAPFPGAVTTRSCQYFGNKFDQILVAAGAGTLDLRGGTTCGVESNSFGCYDQGSPSVGVFSNGASVSSDWNRWSVQPGVFGIDVAGTGVSGFDTRACSAAVFVCP